MYEVHTLYYNNAAHSVLVGEKIRFCNGSVYQWGTVTIYTHIYNEGMC